MHEACDPIEAKVEVVGPHRAKIAPHEGVLEPLCRYSLRSRRMKYDCKNGLTVELTVLRWGAPRQHYDATLYLEFAGTLTQKYQIDFSEDAGGELNVWVLSNDMQRWLEQASCALLTATLPVNDADDHEYRHARYCELLEHLPIPLPEPLTKAWSADSQTLKKILGIPDRGQNDWEIEDGRFEELDRYIFLFKSAETTQRRHAVLAVLIAALDDGMFVDLPIEAEKISWLLAVIDREFATFAPLILYWALTNEYPVFRESDIDSLDPDRRFAITPLMRRACFAGLQRMEISRPAELADSSRG